MSESYVIFVGLLGAFVCGLGVYLWRGNAAPPLDLIAGLYLVGGTAGWVSAVTEAVCNLVLPGSVAGSWVAALCVVVAAGPLAVLVGRRSTAGSGRS